MLYTVSRKKIRFSFFQFSPQQNWLCNKNRYTCILVEKDMRLSFEQTNHWQVNYFRVHEDYKVHRISSWDLSHRHRSELSYEMSWYFTYISNFGYVIAVTMYWGHISIHIINDHQKWDIKIKFKFKKKSDKDKYIFS